MNKLFWTLRPSGTEVLRDLAMENETFSIDRYVAGEFDANNFQWYEMFHHHVYNDNGCDYERMGCYIKEGDVVLDLGANIGIFAHRAETRGAWLEIGIYMLERMKILDIDKISPEFCKKLLDLYESLKNKKFPSLLVQLTDDFDGRVAIDSTILEMLGFSNQKKRLEIGRMLRHELANEIIKLKNIMRGNIEE